MKIEQNTCIIVKFNAISGYWRFIQIRQRIFNCTDTQIMHFILDKILKRTTRLSVISHCKVIWSQKQSVFWSALYKAHHGLLPPYLAGDCQLVSTTRRRQLRSLDISTLVVQRTSTRFGDRCFRCAAARIWNRLHRRWGIHQWVSEWVVS